MGFRLRKNINLGGGFKVNLSKTGVGYSWGVPGARITKTAKGNIRKTYSIPGTGLGYIEESSGKRKPKQPKQNSPLHSDPQINAMQNISSGEIENFQTAEYMDFLDEIKRTKSLNKASNWLLATLLLISTYPVFVLTGIAGIALKLYTRTWGKLNLDYEMDDYSLNKHMRMVNAWKTVSNSDKIWQIIQSGASLNTKKSSGASTLVNRKPFTISQKSPFYLKIDAELIQLKLANESLIFLPDKILIFNKNKIGAVNYEDVTIEVASTNFIESEKVPKDAEIIGSTWEKVNKNGTPDMRYKGNKELPICKYGSISITSNSGLNVLLQISSYDKAVSFREYIK